jgi:hypothetical protein
MSNIARRIGPTVIIQRKKTILSFLFPSVRFDPATNKFMANGVVIGTLRDDFIGHKVVLNHGVALSIHRHHGIVHAAIIRQDVADY